MTKELEALKNIKIRCHSKSMKYDPIDFDLGIVEQALLKPQKDEKIILGIEDYLNQRIEIEPIEDVKKAFIEIRNQLQVIKGDTK